MSNRAMFDHDILILPQHDYLHGGGDAPHRHYILAHHIDNYGTKYILRSNRTYKKWWVSAEKDGFRKSNTASTGSPATAIRWREAIMKGNVRVARREDRLSMERRYSRRKRTTGG